jgi:hypothetical protein
MIKIFLEKYGVFNKIAILKISFQELSKEKSMSLEDKHIIEFLI